QELILHRFLVGAIALLLMLTPVCGSLCRAQACESPQSSAPRSHCHQSAAMHGAAGSAIHGSRLCSQQEAPSAWLRPESLEQSAAENLSRGASVPMNACVAPSAHLAKYSSTASKALSPSPHAFPDSASPLILRL